MKKSFPLRLGKGSMSLLLDQRAVWINAIFVFLLLITFLVSTGMGEQFLQPWRVLTVLFGQGDDFEQLIVHSFRLPRILISVLVGMSLAAAGAILQAVVRNPLASPDIIGITGGASVAVVLFLTLFTDRSNALTVSIQWLPLSAFIGAAIVTFLLYLLAWKDGLSPTRLVLIGVGLWALMKSLTTLFMILGPIHQASQANVWITGSVYGSSWQNVWVLAPITLTLLLIVLIMIRHVNIQELGEGIAVGAGANVQKQRFLLLLISAALTGSAVAFGGGIGFVGLMAPHIARRLVGSSFGALLPLSAVIGAILVLLADSIGRTFFLPVEVPAGVFTAALGAPYFIYLLYRQRNA
ncbi:FecCD family ABC transporter permease [Pseudobacillus badius]|uniref:FecCD family ABC transporter permease n=1 Tax=Bacillus badius TaxID=1455 RepID=UPI0007B0BC80|nr:iron ABC transporter permease [Bacillus badius]KZO00805.1 iron ABC transporter permease [Bacillus badius]MED0666961.1 iron ABC transporter permease [Bacillus badius]OCS88213.1 iron ABC transporter permease [Bacillus badius]OVE53259.1 iron ABC transporter permease [Bacillus badius]TDW05593.1 iron complex transport system permease protein [Bacillus badius]